MIPPTLEVQLVFAFLLVCLIATVLACCAIARDGRRDRLAREQEWRSR